MSAGPFWSHYTVDLARARHAAARARLDGKNPLAAVAWFIEASMRHYRKTTEETAEDLRISEADVWNVRSRLDSRRRAA